jgi:hypothetical protein
MLLIGLPLAGQDRRPATADGGGGRSGPGNSSAGTASIASRGIAMGGTSSTSSSGTGSSRSVGNAPAFVAGGGSFTHVPNLTHTSFSSPSMYLGFNDLLWHMRRYYGFSTFSSGYYFSRFYRNIEPLLNPQIAKLALRQPLSSSMKMIATIDELEALIRDRQAGKVVSQKDIEARTEEIRDLAKEIRMDPSVVFYDQRKNKDLLKGSKLDTLEALAQLRALATDLNVQLKGLYIADQPFAVSIDTLSQPSLQSLSKGIEKLSKNIESAARRI